MARVFVQALAQSLAPGDQVPIADAEATFNLVRVAADYLEEAGQNKALVQARCANVQKFRQAVQGGPPAAATRLLPLLQAMTRGAVDLANEPPSIELEGALRKLCAMNEGAAQNAIGRFVAAPPAERTAILHEIAASDSSGDAGHRHSGAATSPVAEPPVHTAPAPQAPSATPPTVYPDSQPTATSSETPSSRSSSGLQPHNDPRHPSASAPALKGVRPIVIGPAGDAPVLASDSPSTSAPRAEATASPSGSASIAPSPVIAIAHPANVSDPTAAPAKTPTILRPDVAPAPAASSPGAASVQLPARPDGTAHQAGRSTANGSARSGNTSKDLWGPRPHKPADAFRNGRNTPTSTAFGQSAIDPPGNPFDARPAPSNPFDTGPHAVHPQRAPRARTTRSHRSSSASQAAVSETDNPQLLIAISDVRTGSLRKSDAEVLSAADAWTKKARLFAATKTGTLDEKGERALRAEGWQRVVEHLAITVHQPLALRRLDGPVVDALGHAVVGDVAKDTAGRVSVMVAVNAMDVLCSGALTDLEANRYREQLLSADTRNTALTGLARRYVDLFVNTSPR